jgi:uridine kinase
LTDERAAVLRAVAARIAALARPVLVAVDGVTAAGKTMFADELAVLVMPPVVRVSVDDFHRPEAERRAHGEGPESYYHDTFDLPAVRTALSRVDAAAVAIVDGVFPLRPELAGVWSLTIFLATDREVALDRAIARDAADGRRGRGTCPVREPVLPGRDALPRGRRAAIARRHRDREHRPRPAPAPLDTSHARHETCPEQPPWSLAQAARPEERRLNRPRLVAATGRGCGGGVRRGHLGAGDGAAAHLAAIVD